MINSPPKTYRRVRVTTAIVINLTATPGLGSVMCGRWIAGLGQLVFSLSGFFLIMIWMLRLIYHSVMAEMENPVQAPPGWMCKWGVLLFVAGWIWSLVTSFSLWLQVKKENMPGASPHVTNPPPKM